MKDARTNAPKTIAIIDDRLPKSVARDAVTVTGLCGSCLLGWWVGSAALQWIGGILALIVILGKASGVHKGSEMTIQQARDYLDNLAAREGGQS